MGTPAFAAQDPMMGGGPGAQQMSSTMHDMAGQMKQMSDMMIQGKMDPAMQKQTAERMQSMSAMSAMSAMSGKGMMMDADMQKKMGEMRKQMDDMLKQPMTPAKK